MRRFLAADHTGVRMQYLSPTPPARLGSRWEFARCVQLSTSVPVAQKFTRIGRCLRRVLRQLRREVSLKDRSGLGYAGCCPAPTVGHPPLAQRGHGVPPSKLAACLVSLRLQMKLSRCRYVVGQLSPSGNSRVTFSGYRDRKTSFARQRWP